MTGKLITPGDLTARLGVSDRTTRRLADAYSAVYGTLPRVSPASSNRLFPLVAVERIAAAHETMRAVPGMSAVDAFRAQRDGITIPRREERTPDQDALAPVLAELRALRSEVAGLQSLLVTFTGQQLLTTAAHLTDAAAPADGVQPSYTLEAHSGPSAEDTQTPPVAVLAANTEADTRTATPSAELEAAPLIERPSLTGRAAALLEHLESGAQLVDSGGMYRAEKDGQVLQSYSATVGQKLLGIANLLVQVAPGRWSLVPTLS